MRPCALGLGVVLMLVACGPKATPAGGRGDGKTPRTVVPADPATAAREAALAVVARQHDALAAGDHAALTATYAPDVFAFGPRALHVAGTRAEVLRMLSADTTAVGEEGGKLTWAQGTPAVISLAADLRAAWVSEDLDQTLTLAGETRTTRVHVTQLLVATETDGWQAIACSWSVDPADAAEAQSLAALGRRLPELGADDAIPEAARPTVAQLDLTLADAGAWLEGVGPAQPLDAWLGPGMKAARTAGGVRAGVTPSGTVVWIAANLEVESSTTQVRSRPLVHRVRLLAIYELREGAWVAVQRQLSYGHGED